MGLIKAAVSAGSTVLGDQFKEFVTCPQVSNKVIVQRGEVHHGVGNPGASEGIISNGSAIVIPQGMAMMIVDNGKIAEFSAEPGTFTWDTSSEPSVFTGGLWKGIKESISTLGSRITFGGQTAKDQRVYYINTKVIPGMPFGSQKPETVFDPVYESVEVIYNGQFDIRVDDPVVLVNNFVGTNAKDTLTFDDIFTSEADNQLKRDFAQHVGAGISDLMVEDGLSIREMGTSKGKLSIVAKMKDLLDESWRSQYGIVVENVTLNVSMSEESQKRVAEADHEINTRKRMAEKMGEVYANNPNTKDTELVDVLKTAAGNENGSMMGLFGTAMAGNAMGAIMGNGNNQAANNNNQASNGGASAANAAEEIKTCPSCGAQVSGNFCSKCGAQLN